MYVERRQTEKGKYSTNVLSIDPMAFGPDGSILRLLRHHKRGLKAWTIAQKANLHINKVRKILVSLQAQGLVTVFRESGTRGQTNNTYVHVSNLVEISEKVP